MQVTRAPNECDAKVCESYLFEFQSTLKFSCVSKISCQYISIELGKCYILRILNVKKQTQKAAWWWQSLGSIEWIHILGCAKAV